MGLPGAAACRKVDAVPVWATPGGVDGARPRGHRRVAAHLLDLASAQQRPQGRLVAQVSQQELADAVGSVREVVARVLRDLRLAGIVATAPDSVVVLDAPRLQRQSWEPSAT